MIEFDALYTDTISDSHRNIWILDRHLNSQVNIDEICDINIWCTLEKQIRMLLNKYYERLKDIQYIVLMQSFILLTKLNFNGVW